MPEEIIKRKKYLDRIYRFKDKNIIKVITGQRRTGKSFILKSIINDLRKPNSMVRQLIGKAVNKLLESKNKKVEAIDITDKVEILGENNHNRLINS